MREWGGEGMESSPDAVEDEEELDEDAAKWEDASHEGRRDAMRQPGLVRDLSGNLVGTHGLFHRLKQGRRASYENCT